MTWGGGIDLFSILLDGLRKGSWKTSPRFILFVQGSAKPQAWTDPIYNTLINSGVARLSNRLGRRSFAQLAGFYNYDQLDRLHQNLDPSLPVRLFRDAGHLNSLAASMHVDCLLPVSAALAPELKIPALGYIPDLQHVFYPEFFSPEEIAQRNDEFRCLTENLSHIIVNSHHAAKTCQEHFSGNKSAFHALPFAAAPQEDWFQQERERLDQYDLPKSYFLVSNQFWIHKNHQTLFQAFALGVQQNWPADVGLVCTGSTHDYRHPDYFPRLKQYLVDKGLANKVKILGHIPKRDQIEIMKNAIAVVQPTLFEGGPGGGSVYDAISLGIPSILSDIEINRELDGLGYLLHFFSPKDYEQLFFIMNSVLQASDRSCPSASELTAAGICRRNELGSVLAKAIDSTIASSNKAQHML